MGSLFDFITEWLKQGLIEAITVKFSSIFESVNLCYKGGLQRPQIIYEVGSFVAEGIDTADIPDESGISRLEVVWISTMMRALDMLRLPHYILGHPA